MTQYLPTAFEQFIHVSRYSRWLDDKNRRETWEETVKRYCDFFSKKFDGKFDDVIYNELQSDILQCKVMPSMRALMTAGTALERDNIAGYNCAYVAVSSKRNFAEILYVLLNGTGVGFSCERQEVANLPTVPDKLAKNGDVIVVDDSKLGWAKAYNKLINSLYDGDIPEFDYSKVRPAGARLKTFGGRASGPKPLKKLFDYTINEFKKSAGRKLQSIEVHDIVCTIAETIVVGGVRRSALISLSNLSDQRMRDAKSGQWWIEHPERALANNSIAYTEKPEPEIFLEEWLSLVKSKSGERGIINRQALQKQAARWGKRDSTLSYGVNPCCFTGDMRLLTDEGYERFDNLAGKDVRVVSSDGTMSEGTVWSSGLKDVVQVKFYQRRNSIVCTPDHVFMLNDGTECRADHLAKKRVSVFYNLKEDFDRTSFFAGFVQGDGGTGRLDSETHKALEVFIGEKDGDVADFLGLGVENGRCYSSEALLIAENFELSSKQLPERELPEEIRGDFLSGLYSANGCVIKTDRVSLKTTCKNLALQLVEELKYSHDISAYITTNKPTVVKFSNGDYLCRESYDVSIARYSDIVKFAERISFVQKYKREALKKLLMVRAPMVRRVNKLGLREVYDFTEPKNHWGVVEGIVVHNSEIILRSAQFCNLTECVIRSEDTEETLKEKVRLATIMGTFQASLTDFQFIGETWKRNTIDEALLGVSLTGIMDNMLMSGLEGHDNLKGVLNRLRDYSVEVNAEWAGKLGIKPAAAITAVKPSGTVSQLVNSASGVHTRHSKYYLRTVRSDKKDPIYKFMIAKGIYCEDDVMKPESGAVFYFPIKAPEGCLTRESLNAIQQLEIWKLYQDEWCHHKPSVTINVHDNEWVGVGAWVWENFDTISGVSFLPAVNHTYQQAPYIEITEQEYDDWVAKHPIPVVDWTELSEFEKEDTTTGTQQYACSSGVCEII